MRGVGGAILAYHDLVYAAPIPHATAGAFLEEDKFTHLHHPFVLNV